MTQPKTTLPVKIGENIYQMTSDDTYLNYIASGFEPEMVALFKLLVRKQDAILDVGANIGCTTILFGETGRSVFSFEPSPTTFSLLLENTSRTGMDNIYLNNFGLGSSNFSSELTFSKHNRSGGFVSNQTKAGVEFSVETIEIRALDDWMIEKNVPNIDFIKIDVEGFEGHVLRGATTTLKKMEPIVTLELNHWCLNAFQRTSIPDFFDFLNSIFPYVYAVDEKRLIRADLSNPGSRYQVMYEHILEKKFQNIVAHFGNRNVNEFMQKYRPLHEG